MNMLRRLVIKYRPSRCLEGSWGAGVSRIPWRIEPSINASFLFEATLQMAAGIAGALAGQGGGVKPWNKIKIKILHKHCGKHGGNNVEIYTVDSWVRICLSGFQVDVALLGGGLGALNIIYGGDVKGRTLLWMNPNLYQKDWVSLGIASNR